MKQSTHGGNIYRNDVNLDFSANINPFGTPKSVINAMVESLSKSANYPDPHCTKLVESLSLHHEIDKEYILCGNGAADLIFTMMTTIKPKKALIQAPTFAEYEQALKSVDSEIEYFHTFKRDNFMITENILSKINKDLDVIFLCNPNNPTGVLICDDLLLRIAEKCKKTKTYLIIDECFQEFIKENHSLKNELIENSYIIILKAFTKIYALAGVRLGYCMTSNLTLLNRMKDCTQPWNVSIVAQSAGISALKETEFVKSSTDYLHEQREFLVSKLFKLGYKVYPSKANYILFETDPDLYQKCLGKKVLIRDCSNYVGLEKGFYRIAVRTFEENEKLIKVFTEIEKERVIIWMLN